MLDRRCAMENRRCAMENRWCATENPWRNDYAAGLRFAANLRYLLLLVLRVSRNPLVVVIGRRAHVADGRGDDAALGNRAQEQSKPSEQRTRSRRKARHHED